MKLDLRQPLLNLSGEPIKDDQGKHVELGRVMANAIVSINNTTDPTRNYILATKFHQDDEIDLNADDLVYVREQMKMAGTNDPRTNIFPTLYKGQVLVILDKLDKDDGKKEETQQEQSKEKKTKKD